MGGEEPWTVGALPQGHCPRSSLALCEQRGGHRFSRQGDSAQAGSRAQGLGILYGEPDLASQRRDKPRGAQVHHGNLCRANEGSTAGSVKIHRSELSATSDQRARRKMTEALHYPSLGCRARTENLCSGGSSIKLCSGGVGKNPIIRPRF